MRAICKTSAAKGGKLIEAPLPTIDEHAALIKVKATSICGTDVHIYNWDAWAAGRITPPLIFGHECAGEVVEVGKKVTSLRVGDHVSVETHVPCQHCFQCRTGLMHLCQHLKVVGIDRPGSFAEYVAIPEICCVKNDHSLPWEVASLQEPLGNAVYCVNETGVAGKTVALFGDGPIGIFAVAVARALGAEQLIVCGMQPYRMKMMQSFQPDVLINVRDEDPRQRILELTGGQGVDVVLEMSGASRAIHDGFAVLRRGGTFTFFGVPSKPLEIDVAEEILFKGITIKSIYGRRMFETWEEMKTLLDTGRLDIQHVITHEFPLEKIDAAMALLNAQDVQVGKILLRP